MYSELIHLKYSYLFFNSLTVDDWKYAIDISDEWSFISIFLLKWTWMGGRFTWYTFRCVLFLGRMTPGGNVSTNRNQRGWKREKRERERKGEKEKERSAIKGYSSLTFGTQHLVCKTLFFLFCYFFLLLLTFSLLKFSFVSFLYNWVHPSVNVCQWSPSVSGKEWSQNGNICGWESSSFTAFGTQFANCWFFTSQLIL